MSDKCNCGPDCACKKVTVDSRRIIEQVLLRAEAKTVLECLDNLEEFCDKKGYVLDRQAMHYGFSGALVSMSVIARKYGEPEVQNADL